MVNRFELIREISIKTGFKQADIRMVMDALDEVVTETIPHDRVKVLSGLVLYTDTRKGMLGRNPQTGEPMEIKERIVPKAHFVKSFKDRIAGMDNED